MTWKKHFRTVSADSKMQKAYTAMQNNSTQNLYSNKFSSHLPEVYSGNPNRIQRYLQYEQMANDPEIGRALDIIASFCSKKEEKSRSVFNIYFEKEANEAEIEMLKVLLRQWDKINNFNGRLFRMFRNTVMYGDQFYIRDPETYEWLWMDQSKVSGVCVDESDGKTPSEYIFKDLDFNILLKVASQPNTMGTDSAALGLPGGANRVTTDVSALSSSPYSTVDTAKSRFASGPLSETKVDAIHVIHLTLCEGMDSNAPFGTSILERVFKVFKQKELLEDSVVIYRVQRAPERRVFYVDVGNAPPHKAHQMLEKIKNEIQQKRIPNRTGGGSNIIDAAYNPMSMLEDFYFSVSADNRGSRVDTLPAGENLGQIDDLRYFNNKLIRGMNVPSSYIATGPEDGTASYNDGKVGVAYQQELSFSDYCERIQNLLALEFDDEFKLFVKSRGANIDSSLFTLEFNPPQNFAKYRQVDMDSAVVDIFERMQDKPYISKRFAMKRFLGLGEDEIVENEEMWKMENPEKVKNKTGTIPSDETGSSGGSSAGFGDLGIRPDSEDIGAEPEEGTEETPTTPETGEENAGGEETGGAGGELPL